MDLLLVQIKVMYFLILNILILTSLLMKLVSWLVLVVMKQLMLDLLLKHLQVTLLLRIFLLCVGMVKLISLNVSSFLVLMTLEILFGKLILMVNILSLSPKLPTESWENSAGILFLYSTNERGEFNYS